MSSVQSDVFKVWNKSRRCIEPICKRKPRTFELYFKFILKPSSEQIDIFSSCGDVMYFVRFLYKFKVN